MGKGHRRDQTRAERVPFQMVDSVIGKGARGGDGLGRDRADHHAANQPRPAGGGHRVDLVNADICSAKCRRDHLVNSVKMRAGGDFRHHTAMRRVNLHLRGNLAGQNGAVAAHHGGSGFITAAFDAKDQEGVVHRLPPVVAFQSAEHRPLGPG